MILDLNGTWAFRQAATVRASREARLKGEWLPAAVPGCVHLDLMEAGRIPDPFYGFNDQEVQWVAEAHWIYRRTFDCPPELASLPRVDLVCLGLDTFATVRLNGREIGQADNMFRRWRWNVTELLRKGHNELVILFESPKKVGEAHLAKHGELVQRCSEGPERVYNRKAQYATGWDWGPNLNTSGIWKPVYLEGVGAGRIADVCVRTDWADPAKPVVRALVELESMGAGTAKLSGRLAASGSRHTASATIEVQPGVNDAVLAFRVSDPKLWWPAGMGPQHLYQLTVDAAIEGEQLPTHRQTTGLRRVELRREPDDEGETFVICVNDEPVFCKGANWVPADSFLPRLTAADYEDLVRLAVDANMNMLRAWGGGVYEADEFYEACDRLGVMVWQDFQFACAEHPDWLDWFCKSVRCEAVDNVRRLRNHPSLVLWCGNNENQMFYETGGEWAGRRIYHELLPEVCAEHDPTRPYWPGSPYGGSSPSDATAGDQHYWDPWYSWEDADAQRRYNGRFIDEFGVEAPPDMATIRRYISSHGHNMLSREMEHHNRCWWGSERMYRHLSAMFRIPASFADNVYLLQLTQAEVIRIGVEYWRTRKFRTAGTLFWQYNDCWPAVSWSCLDCERRPKALYYYARRFFAPVLAVIDRRSGRFTVSIVNDRLEPFAGELVCGFGCLSGDQEWVVRNGVSVPANGVLAAESKAEAELDLSRLDDRYFWCRLLEDGQQIGSTAWLMLPPKHMALERPEWTAEATQSGPGEFEIRLTPDTFAKGVCLRIEGVEAEFADNFFDALAEVSVGIAVSTARDMSPQELLRRLVVRTVADVRYDGGPGR